MKRGIFQSILLTIGCLGLVACGATTPPPTDLEVGAKYQYSHSVFTSHETIILEVKEDGILVTQSTSAEIHDQQSSQSTVYTFGKYEKQGADNVYSLSEGSCKSTNEESGKEYSGDLAFKEDGTIALSIKDVSEIQNIEMRYVD